MMASLSNWLLALVPTYGPWLMAAATYLSCLALPVPVSILMLSAGGFVASGDLVGWQIVGSALGGAVAGDQTGYFLGRFGGKAWMERLGRDPKSGKLVKRAAEQMDRRGSLGIFLTRWLFTVVGPYANFAAGAGGFSWAKFSVWGGLGEAIWVGMYIALGYGFAGNIQAASDMAGSMLGILAGVAAMLGFGTWLVMALRADKGGGGGAA
jgi:membrane protein DedA with SNARE-associated domain